MKRHRRQLPRTPRTTPSTLDRVCPDAAGIDCGSAEHFVAVPPDRDPQLVRAFAAFTADLYQLADWLTACQVTTVAMEATGVYWIALFDILESRGFTVRLVNARHVRNVPGRKSDVADCEGLRDLLMVGLLRGSFRPAQAIVVLRAYLRHRETLIQGASTHVQRTQKALVQMNLQLLLVVADIMGVTGLRILRDIVAGQTDPAHLTGPVPPQAPPPRTPLRRPDIPPPRDGRRPVPTRRPRPLQRLAAALGDWHRHVPLAFRQTLHVLADSGTPQQDLRGAAAQQPDTTVRQSRRRHPAAGGRQPRPGPDRPRCVLSSPRRPGRQTQGHHATARKLAILVYHTLKDGLVYADPGAVAYEASTARSRFDGSANAPPISASNSLMRQPARSSKGQFLRRL
jgi:hypothetical protein